HFATRQSVAFAAERSGATVRLVPIYARPEAVTEDEVASVLRRAITPKVRLIAMTWVHSSTGVKLPVRALADLVAQANRGLDEADRIFLCIDGVQGFGIERAKTGELGCDFFSAGCHKWLFGPRGTGVAWATPAFWAATRATIPSFEKESFDAIRAGGT